MGGKHEFLTLDGLRGVAAIVVATLHVQFFFQVLPIEADLAVDFFFALSGFVLAFAYSEKLRKGLKSDRFMMLRLIRLYPLYALGSAIWLPLGVWMLVVDHASAHTMAVNVTAAILFVPSLASPLLYPLNPPAWSLFSELLANAGLGLCARWLSGRVLAAIMAIAVIALFVGTNWYGPMINGHSWATLWSGPLRVAYSFPAGILAYEIWRRAKAPISFPAPIIGLLLLGLLAIPSPHAGMRALATVIIAFPALVWLGASSHPRGAVERLCQWLGAISYALYAVHYPIYFYAERLATRFLSPDMPRWPWGVVTIAVSIAAADLGNRLDIPVRRFLNARLLRSDSAAQSSVRVGYSTPQTGADVHSTR